MREVFFSVTPLDVTSAEGSGGSPDSLSGTTCPTALLPARPGSGVDYHPSANDSPTGNVPSSQPYPGEVRGTTRTQTPLRGWGRSPRR